MAELSDLAMVFWSWLKVSFGYGFLIVGFGVLSGVGFSLLKNHVSSEKVRGLGTRDLMKRRE